MILIVPIICEACPDYCTYKKEIFSIPADAVGTLLFPVFSSNSTFEQFNSTFSKAIDICDYGFKKFNFTCYINDYHEFGTVIYNSSDPIWKDETVLRHVYARSIRQSFTDYACTIKSMEDVLTNGFQFCMKNNCTEAVRNNIILLTDLPKFPEIRDLEDYDMQQLYWFVITASSEQCEHVQSPDNCTNFDDYGNTKYLDNYIKSGSRYYRGVEDSVNSTDPNVRYYTCYHLDNITIDDDMIFELLGDTLCKLLVLISLRFLLLDFPLDVTKNYYNGFITVNVTSEEQLYTVMQYIFRIFAHQDSQYFVSPNAANFVAISVQINNIFYETGKISFEIKIHV